MDLLKEQITQGIPADRSKTFEVIHSSDVLQEKVNGFNEKELLLLFRNAKRKGVLIDSFKKIDGGSHLECKTEIVVSLYRNKITTYIRLFPARDGFVDYKGKLKGCEPRIHLGFDLFHDHLHGLEIEIPLYKSAKGRSIVGLTGALASERDYRVRSNTKKGWGVEKLFCEKYIFLKVDLDLKKWGVDLKKHPSIGFACWRHQAVHGHVEASLWPFGRSFSVLPCHYGTLLLSSQKIKLHQIDLSHPIYGKNRAHLVIENMGNRSIRLQCRTFTNAPHQKKTFSNEIILSGKQKKKISQEYHTSIFDWADQDITFEIEVSGKLWYRSVFKAGGITSLSFHGSYMQLKHRLEKGRKRGAASPSPGEENFYFKKRQYILSNMPNYERDTKCPTRYLHGSIGKKKVVSFDLSQKSVIKRIARHIESLFDTADDRILAALYFVHQTHTWSGTFSKFTQPYEPLAAMRLGYILCDSFSNILIFILKNIKNPDTGKYFSAHYCTSVHHVITAVDRGDDHVLLDANLGFFIPNPESGRLATHRELLRNPKWVNDVIPGRKEDYLEKNPLFLSCQQIPFAF